MIRKYAADARYQAEHGWLHSRFSFSFADYYDPNNLQFGPMRVLNDDVIEAGYGFGMHPHKEMEIVTVVLEGHLEHEDSMGNKARTTFGGIQRMSAGTGVYHSEMNPSKEEAVKLLQMWFLPDTRGLQPSYEQTSFDPQQLRSQLVPVVSKKFAEPGKVAMIHQDMTMYLSELSSQEMIHYTPEEGRRVFIFVIHGALQINDQQLAERDSARIEGEAQLTIQAKEETRWMLIDLP